MYLPKRKRREKHVCPVCEGIGKVKVKKNEKIVLEICPRCDGSGYIYV